MQWVLSQELRIHGARCLAPEELRSHMEDRFTSAVSRGQAVSALACEPIGLERVASKTGVLNALTLALEATFRAPEAAVYVEGGCLVALLVGVDQKRIESACHEWIAAAKELRVDGEAAPMRIGLRIGYGVTQPGKRLFLDTLNLVARAGLDVARYRGAGACVHTMLYDSLQNHLELKRGSKGMVVRASEPLPASETVRAEARANGQAKDEVVVATPPPAPAPAQASVVTEVERRERELAAALEAERRNSEALRARLLALEAETTHVDLLERRLAKVVRALEETEERLDRVLREAPVDPGIASLPMIPGLAPDSPYFELKAALMQQIFEANVRLRELAESQRSQV